MRPSTKLLIFLTKCLLVLNCIQGNNSADSNTARLESELYLDDLELVDICENIASAKKTVYLVENYEDKIKQEEAYGLVIKTHYNILKNYNDVPTNLERNVTFQVKAGDGLLPEDEWNNLVVYKNHIERIANHMKLLQSNDSDLSLIGKENYHRILSTSRVLDDHKSTWTGWQGIYNVSVINAFPKHLQLVKEAATLNGFDTVHEYWETLTDFQGGYSQADQFWEEISPFYNRLLRFVRTRLFKYYSYNVSQDIGAIPVYLLGSPLGSDWSNIADIILPHPQLHYDVESYLRYKDVKDIYKYSENVVKSMGLGTLGDKFWEKSNFSATKCGPEIFEFCDTGYTEIAECNKSSWKVYLDAHETSLKISLNNMDYLGLTRQRLRYSSVEDAVETLGSLLAINSLPYHGIVNEDIYDDTPANMTKLLLTALRVMPRLSYYIMADKWRLEEIDNNDTSVVESYWKFRKQYNGLMGETNTEPEFLEDTHILANKPYISKFFGTLIAFQLFEYYRDRSEDLANVVEDFGKEETFIDMLKEGYTTDWPYLISLHYSFDVTSADLLKYFEPLEEYFEDAPEEQLPIVTTTIAPTITTTTSTTSTARPAASTSVVAAENADVLSDEPKVNATQAKENIENLLIKDSHVGMWVGVSLVVLVGCLLTYGLGYKMLRKKRRTNNRRFDT